MRESQDPPESFVQQVKEALEHIYDLGYLQNHPLAQEVRHGTVTASEIAGQRLRRELAAALETLNPGEGVPFSAPHARFYNLLDLHYMEKMTVREAAHEIGISLRQAQRDLRRAIESVATVLWARRAAFAPEEPRAATVSSLEAEMARLANHPHPIDVCLLLHNAKEAVEPLAVQRNVRFRIDVPAEPVIVSTDRTVAEQVLINTLSRATNQAQPGPFDLQLRAGGQRASITLRYFPEPGATKARVPNLLITQLADRLRWKVDQADCLDGIRTVTVQVTQRRGTVLVIDDNEGLVELMKRYLTDHACRVVAASDGQEGLRLAQEIEPDAIVLDVMMPGMHGWDVLQRLRNHPRTLDIPVIVCSVITNPELAQALGASLFLPKPVNQDNVLEALHQVGVV